MLPSAPTERDDCLLCRRPPRLCVCDVIRPVENVTGVTILQHPAERSHPFGTVKLVRRALTRVEVHVAWPGDDGLLTRHLDLPPGAGLLYPSPESRDLAELPEGERPTHLLVLDGTWSTAQRLYRDNPWMASLPHYRLQPPAPSAYRIRLEPAPHCLSTAESISVALHLLEPATPGLERILDGFHALVDRQLAHIEALGAAQLRQRKLRDGPVSRTEHLAAHWDRVVVVYGEATQLHTAEGRLARDLLQWAAYRPSTGETFEAFAHPDGPPPTDRLLEKMELDRELLATAPPVSALVEAWRAFTRPDDLLAIWSEDTSRLFRAATWLEPEFIQLKSTWCNHDPEPTGTLAELVARLGLTPPSVALRGRAAERVGNATAVAERLAAVGREKLALRGL